MPPPASSPARPLVWTPDRRSSWLRCCVASVPRPDAPAVGNVATASASPHCSPPCPSCPALRARGAQRLPPNPRNLHQRARPVALCRRPRRHLVRRSARQIARGSPAGAGPQSCAEVARGPRHAMLRWRVVRASAPLGVVVRVAAGRSSARPFDVAATSRSRGRGGLATVRWRISVGRSAFYA
jgi:hypothetical protein